MLLLYNENMTAEEFLNGFAELRRTTPKIAVSGYSSHNCPYGNAIYNSKNCYLCFDMDTSEGCLYSGTVTRAQYCGDCEDIWDSELCYEGYEIYHCYNCDFSQFLRNCSDCSYCFDCLNCQNCFGCVGLRRQNYSIFNKPYSPEVYKIELEKAKKLPREEIETRVEALRKEYPHLASRQYQSENCIGDNIQNSKGVFYGFNVKNTFDGGYAWDLYTVYGDRNEDTYDTFFNVDLHSCYECVQVGDGWNLNFCHYCEHIRDSEFCEACFNSKNLFGCIGINRGEYMILNKAYAPEDWKTEVAEIKKGLAGAGKFSWGIFAG